MSETAVFPPAPATESAIGTAVVELVPERRFSVLGIRRAIQARKLRNEEAQYDSSPNFPPSPIPESGGASFYQTMAEDILGQSGYTRGDDGNFKTDAYGNYVRDPSTGYDPLKRFGEAHRTKRAEFGEVSEPPSTKGEATTIVEYGASRRRNLWLDKVNKQQHIQHEMHQLLEHAGEHIETEEDLERVFASGRFPLVRRRALQSALRTSNRAKATEQKYLHKLVKTANGEDIFKNFGSIDDTDAQAEDEKNKMLGEKIDSREKKIDKINKKIQKNRHKRTERKARGKVRSIAAKAYVGRAPEAWRSRAERGLEERELFYDELGRVLERDAVGRDERMTGTLKGMRSGRIRDAATRWRAGRQKKMLDYFGSTNNADKAKKHKRIMEERGKSYRDSAFSVRKRRRNNAEKLRNQQAKQAQRYRNLAQAKRQLADLESRRPS